MNLVLAPWNLTWTVTRLKLAESQRRRGGRPTASHNGPSLYQTINAVPRKIVHAQAVIGPSPPKPFGPYATLVMPGLKRNASRTIFLFLPPGRGPADVRQAQAVSDILYSVGRVVG